MKYPAVCLWLSVFLYFKLYGLLRRSVGSGRFLLHAGTGSVRTHRNRVRDGEYFHKYSGLFALPQPYSGKKWIYVLLLKKTAFWSMSFLLSVDVDPGCPFYIFIIHFRRKMI